MPLYSIETYGELRPHLQEEWLLTNGIGGFASGTIVGCNARRYHGLLCAALLPPVGRFMMLNRVGEILKIRGKSVPFELSINQFADKFHPRGDRYLRRFDLEIELARWEYEVEGVRISKEIQLAWGKNATGIRYTIDPGKNLVEFSILPFVRMMDFHALRREKADFIESHGQRKCSVGLGPNTLTITADAGYFEPEPDWWYGQTYAIETERGLDDREDLYKPGRFTVEVSKTTAITLWAVAEPMEQLDWETESPSALGRREICSEVVVEHSSPLSCRKRFCGRSQNPRWPARPYHHRRLSLVRRLGPRHDDLPARSPSCPRAIR